MTDIVDRLRRWTHDPHVPPASDLMDEAADEIVRLRGELVLWKAAATLTRDERQVLEQAIASATLVGTEDQVRRLRWLLERLTFPVPEPMPKEKRAEVSVTLTDAEREALHHVVGDVADITGPVEDIIRGLLERLG